MLIEDQYGIGDSVDLGVAAGAVEKITMRTTVARGQDGTLWHVPNGEIRRVGNRSKLYSVAVLDIHVAYDADLVLTRRVVHDVAQQVCESEDYAGDVLSSPDLLGVEEVTADGVTLRLLVKTAPGMQFRLQRALREAIKAGLDVAGVAVLPPPAREGGHPNAPGGAVENVQH
jgi:moderate conductance mechanosensitive channel